MVYLGLYNAPTRLLDDSMTAFGQFFQQGRFPTTGTPGKDDEVTCGFANINSPMLLGR